MQKVFFLLTGSIGHARGLRLVIFNINLFVSFPVGCCQNCDCRQRETQSLFIFIGKTFAM